MSLKPRPLVRARRQSGWVAAPSGVGWVTADGAWVTARRGFGFSAQTVAGGGAGRGDVGLEVVARGGRGDIGGERSGSRPGSAARPRRVAPRPACRADPSASPTRRRPPCRRGFWPGRDSRRAEAAAAARPARGPVRCSRSPAQSSGRVGLLRLERDAHAAQEVGVRSRQAGLLALQPPQEVGKLHPVGPVILGRVGHWRQRGPGGAGGWYATATFSRLQPAVGAPFAAWRLWLAGRAARRQHGQRSGRREGRPVLAATRSCTPIIAPGAPP